MKTILKIVKIINTIGLLFLILGPYGLAITGLLQVISAIIFIALFPKNKLIYAYFILVLMFFSIWDRSTMNWLFILPIFLIFFLTFTIYNQKI